MRVVLDCNVVIAAARTDGVCRSVLLQVVRAHELVVSPPILEEYRSVGARPKHRLYHRTMAPITDLVERVAMLVEAPLDRRFLSMIPTMRSTSPPRSPAGRRS
jgi:predicted nucleic acid-binding protein